MSGGSCVFCAIVEGSAPAEVVEESDRALAFMDINPATDGHTLVVPRAHAADIWDLDPEDGRAVWSLVQVTSSVIRSGLHPDGLTIFQANGAAGWQEVFHFHVHLVPRWRDDGLVRPWRSNASRRAGIAETAERLRRSRA